MIRELAQCISVRIEPITNQFKMKQNYTYSSRYNDRCFFQPGITDHIQKHAKENCLETVKVVDVGCSTGVAMRDCARQLSGKGIILETAGVDQAEKVKSEAEANVNRFIMGDIMSLTVKECHSLMNADVVILSRVLRYVDGKSELQRRCAGFLKTGGILLVNNGHKTIVKTKESVMNGEI